MKPEQIIQNKIRLALSEYGICFRTNSGKIFTGDKVWSNEHKQYVLINLRAVEGLPKGFSDTLFVGKDKVAFIEIKQPGENPRPEQENFLSVMRSYGHIAGCAHSVEEAVDLVKSSVKP